MKKYCDGIIDLIEENMQREFQLGRKFTLQLHLHAFLSHAPHRRSESCRLRVDVSRTFGTISSCRGGCVVWGRRAFLQKLEEKQTDGRVHLCVDGSGGDG